MKLLFKQRLFTWFDSYDIYDEAGNTAFVVKGKISWGHCLNIYDSQGRQLGTVKEEIFTLMPRFRMYTGEECIGEIRKEFTLFKPKFTLSCNNWEVDGNFLEWDYVVRDIRSVVIMIASKKVWNFTDTYEIEIGREEDVLYSLMIVLAIDAAKCSK